MKIFISGSRNFLKIKFDKYFELSQWLKNNNHEVLVGDCTGIDEIIRKICKNQNIKCTVYHIGTKPRNQESEKFQTKRIKGTKQENKDIAMTNDCDLAIAIWNGESKGTKANIERCKNQNKQVIVRY